MPSCEHGDEYRSVRKKGDRSQDRESTYCTKCALESNASYYERCKRWAVEYKGGECIVCGYSKHLAALDFHHLRPEEKKFSLCSSNLSMGTPRVIKELDKCVLLCSNCHREYHAGHITLPQTTYED